mgnify:FL=1
MMRKAPHNGGPTLPRTTPIAQGHNHTLKNDKTRKNIPPTIIILTKNMHT